MIKAATLDYIVIVAYFLGITGLGIFFGRFTRSTKDFFFGGQRFSWWMVAMSCVATVVGSYSFIKYSAVGFKHGLSSTMTYLNDWFIVPFFVFGWLPIIYFNRIHSIPEYFAQRFDQRTKTAAIAIILVYMVGYVGINFYTLGVALQPILNLNLYVIVLIIAVLGGLYMHAGGQTSVIMTDIVQGFILLTAGMLLFFLGLDWFGGIERFWQTLPESHQLPFSSYNKPHDFPFVGIFWQDAAASSVAFWFMSQGTIMRFLSARSPREGRRAMFFIILVLMPLASFALANGGWFGKAMVELGMLPSDEVNSRNVFVHVAYTICQPGVFGFILAALTAALMSTIDTLINAISAIFVNDIWKPFIEPGRDDKHYLYVARGTAIGAAIVGVALVPLFASYKSIYSAHGVFIATVTPAMVMVIMLSVFWKRFTPTAAFWTLVLGSAVMAVAGFWPDVIKPFSHGIDSTGNFKFIRAFFGLVCAGAIAVTLSFFSKRKNDNEVAGLVLDSVDAAKRRFKGASPNDEEYGKPARGSWQRGNGQELLVPADMLKRMKAGIGDLVHVADGRWYLGGLVSLQAKITGTADGQEIVVGSELLTDNEVGRAERLSLDKII